MTTQDQINSFHQFATSQLKSGSALSIDELYDSWRTENSSPEDNAAVEAAIDDMENGDRGVPIGEHLTQVQEKYNLPRK